MSTIETGRLEFEVAAKPSYQSFLSLGESNFRRHADISESGNTLHDALNQYSRALEENPDSCEALAGMARVFASQGLQARALQYARKVLALAAPDRKSKADAYYVQGQVAFYHQDYREAIANFSQAIKFGGFQGAKARFQLHRTLKEMAAVPGTSFTNSLFMGLVGGYALFTGVAMLPLSPDRVKIAQALQMLPSAMFGWYNRQCGNQETALSVYLDLHQQFPGMAGVMISIGELYREKNELDKASYWLEKAIARHPGLPDAYYYRGRVQEQQEDYEAMTETYQKLLKLKPNDAHVHCHLANAYYHANEHKEALVEYESALNLGNDKAWQSLVAQSMAAIQADFMQNTDAAISYYEMARLLDPTDVESYLQLGLLYFQKEDYANAKLIYAKALAISPRNPRLFSNLGYLHWMEGDIENAIRHYHNAIKLDPSYEIPLNNLGVIHLDTLGNVRTAIDYFKQAAELNENYALAFYNLGRAYSLIDDRLEAAKYFQKAQNLNEFSHELDGNELADRISSLFETSN